jgi:hypothetical protein
MSIIAAVLAIDMYSLLRVGQFGRTWRILIVASVVFVLLQVLRMTDLLLNVEAAHDLSQVVELVFAITLAYAFYRQRSLYTCKLKRQQDSDAEDGEEDN